MRVHIRVYWYKIKYVTKISIFDFREFSGLLLLIFIMFQFSLFA